ncbi:MAG TPA: class I SAM-dependent rRNA methyltransferase [bacterium]|nr:class I SAM-dependent rRNA methyltransferase [bacterium]
MRSPAEPKFPFLTIHLKPRGGKRAKAGHPWIFSNEVAHPAPLPEPGTLVHVIDDGGNFVGYATYNPHSLIALRLLSRDPEDIPGSVDWFASRIERAVSLRRRLYPDRRSCRLIYADSDFLPGVIVDRYEEILAVQVLSAGMERLTLPFLEALKQIVAPKAIVLRNTNEKRKLEGLALYEKVAHGALSGLQEIEENGIKLLVDVQSGQKTGHFFDQVENRRALAAYAHDAEVLDLFCHTGAWALTLLRAGAKNAIAVDSSAAALDLAHKNVEVNGLANRMKCVLADAFAWLSQARKSGWRFDIVVVDPPAFAKTAKDTHKALRGYEDLNRQALHVVRDGGVFCSCSCSSYITGDQFLQTLQRAAVRERRRINVLEIRGQARDHPVLLAMPESRYLKCVIGIVEPL